jgi:hypothetical protein
MSEASGTKAAVAFLQRKMQADPFFAWAWHCNIAMPFFDEGGSHEMANRGAARAMQALFGVDVTKFPEWKAFPWAGDSTAESPTGEA